MGGGLQPLYGWSVDFTIAYAVGYTIEFGEIYDPNSGKTQQFISYGFAYGIEQTAGLNFIFIKPKENFKFSDLEGDSWGFSGSFVLSAASMGNSMPDYQGLKQYDSYYLWKVGLGPGAGVSHTPSGNTDFLNWIPSRFWWDYIEY